MGLCLLSSSDSTKKPERKPNIPETEAAALAEPAVNCVVDEEVVLEFVDFFSFSVNRSPDLMPPKEVGACEVVVGSVRFFIK